MNLSTDESNDLLKSDLMSLCSSIGAIDNNTKFVNEEDGIEVAQYVVEDTALDSLKEIKHLIKIQTKEKYGTVRLLLGQWNIFQKDLVPIFLIEEEDFWTLKLHSLELLVILSWPIKDLVDDSNFDETLEQHSMKTNLLEHYRVMMSYKKSVIYNKRFFREIVKLLVFRLQKLGKWSDEDNMIFLQCLNLIRNLLAAEEINEYRSEDTLASVSSNLQGLLFQRLKESQFLDLLVAVASSVNESQYQQFYSIIMDILYYINRGYHLDDITIGSKLRNGNNKIVNALKSNGEYKRHSRFGGTFEVRLPNGKSALYHDHQLNDLAVLEAGKKSKNIVRNSRRADLDKIIQPKMNSAQRDIFIQFYHDLIKDAFQDLYKASQRGINNSGLESQIRKFNFLEVCIHFANYHWSLDEKWRDMVLVQTVMESVTPQSVIHEIVTNLIGFKDAKKWSAFSQTLETFTEWLRLIYNQSKFPLDDYPVLKELANQVLHHLCHDYANLHIVSQLYSNEIPNILNSKIIKLTFYFNQSVKRMVSDRETVFVQKKRIHRIKRNKKAGKEQRTPSPHRIARGDHYDNTGQVLNSSRYENNQQSVNSVAQDGRENSDIENDSNEDGDFVEGVFDFKKYIGTFANESVVNAHINYLNHILDDTDNSLVEFKLQYVSKMLHSIGVEADYAPLLLKVSYLQIYGKSLDLLSKWELGHFNGTIPRWLKELVKLIEYLISKLVSELQKNPWLFAELLMSKGKHYFRAEEVKPKRTRKRKAGDLGSDNVGDSWLDIYQNEQNSNFDQLFENSQPNLGDDESSVASNNRGSSPAHSRSIGLVDELGLFGNNFQDTLNPLQDESSSNIQQLFANSKSSTEDPKDSPAANNHQSSPNPGIADDLGLFGDNFDNISNPTQVEQGSPALGPSRKKRNVLSDDDD